MKFLFILLVVGQVWAHSHHMPLDLTFEESQLWYQQISEEGSLKSMQAQEPEIEAAIKAGEVLSKWLEKINANRGENPIRLTSQSTRRGIPISAPSKYGPSTLKKTHQEFAQQMPKALYNVFYGKAAMTEKLPMAENEFVDWCRKVSKHYQSAVRWTGMQQWRAYYAQRRFDDVRGYYHLNQIKNLDDTLTNYRSQSTAEKQKLKTALEGICVNKLKNESSCQKAFTSYASKGKLVEFKNLYWKNSERIWNSFFNISNPRTDIHWNSSNPYVMEIPFLDPKNDEVARWLKENVEDEFKRDLFNWNMLLTYVGNGGRDLSRLDFQPNVTPHVTGGNLIVMDANTPLEEYEVKWTIRHEFGHILRLPDCYFEFYQPSEDLMVNYQLDVTDLMCSRAGDMNDRIYQELKRVYFKN